MREGAVCRVWVYMQGEVLGMVSTLYSAYFSFGGFNAYATSKVALLSFANLLRRECLSIFADSHVKCFVPLCSEDHVLNESQYPHE